MCKNISNYSVSHNILGRAVDNSQNNQAGLIFQSS